MHTDTPAMHAAARRGISVSDVDPADHYGYGWEASVPQPGRGKQPMVSLLAPTAELAAREALAYIGARNWERTRTAEAA